MFASSFVLPAFASISSSWKNLMAVEKTKSPKISSLKIQINGVEQSAETRKVPRDLCDVAVEVSETKKDSWAPILSSIVREVAQNGADACARVVKITSSNIIAWTCQSVSNGALLYLDNKLACELLVYSTLTPDTNKWEVKLMFYNRGCALQADSLLVGSIKGDRSTSTITPIAGCHGLGLKDVIGLALANGGTEFTSVRLLTHTPEGIAYENDDRSVTTCHYRSWSLHHTERVKPLNHPNHETYCALVEDFTVENLTETNLPQNVTDLFRGLHSTRDLATSVAGTIVIFTKEGFSSQAAADVMVQRILTESRQHMLLVDTGNYASLVTLNNSKIPHEIHLAQTDAARAVTANNFVIYLSPGLLYCTVPTNSARPNRLCVTLSCKEVQTNRDRKTEWTDSLKHSVGAALFYTMLNEMNALHHFTKLQVKAAYPDFEPLPLLMRTLELHCPVTFEVVQMMCDDFAKPATEDLSAVVEAMVAITKHDIRGKRMKNDSRISPIVQLIGNTIFCDFEVVTTPRDWEVLTALTDLAKTRPSETALLALKNPILIEGPPAAKIFLATSKAVEQAFVNEFLTRECQRSEEWRPAARDDENMTRTFDLATRLDGDTPQRLRAYVLDVPPVLFPKDAVEPYVHLKDANILAICKATGSALYTDDCEMLVTLQRFNPSFGKSAIKNMLFKKPRPPPPTPSRVELTTGCVPASGEKLIYAEATLLALDAFELGQKALEASQKLISYFGKQM